VDGYFELGDEIQRGSSAAKHMTSLHPWPDNLRSEISFSRTCNIPQHCKSTKTRTSYLNLMCTLFVFW